jgi:hypothetical protein
MFRVITVASATRALTAGHWYLKDRKGAEMSAWPADLRVREFPG